MLFLTHIIWKLASYITVGCLLKYLHGLIPLGLPQILLQRLSSTFFSPKFQHTLNVANLIPDIAIYIKLKLVVHLLCTICNGTNGTQEFETFFKCVLCLHVHYTMFYSFIICSNLEKKLCTIFYLSLHDYVTNLLSVEKVLSLAQ